MRAICNALGSTKDGNLGEGFFLDLLRRGFSEDEARQQLKIAIDWGRYGELFDFDANTGQLTLEGPHNLDSSLTRRRSTRGSGQACCPKPFVTPGTV